MKVYKKLLKHMKIWEVFDSKYNFVTYWKVYYHHAHTTGTYICSHVCSFDWDPGIKEKSLREGLKIFGCASDAHQINENKKKNGELQMVVLSLSTAQKTYLGCSIGAYLPCLCNEDFTFKLL